MVSRCAVLVIMRERSIKRIPRVCLKVSEMKVLTDTYHFNTSDAAMIYVKCPMSGELSGPQINEGQYEPGDVYAYTVENILSYLPDYFIAKGDGTEIRIAIRPRKMDQEAPSESGNTLLEAAYKMLLWCLENRWIETPEILNNER